jgi:ribosomal protein S18 acetylase RimI-like enzyme
VASAELLLSIRIFLHRLWWCATLSSGYEQERTTIVIEQVVTEQVQVRPAQPQDIPAIAALLVEGFGHQYGWAPNSRAVQRMYERTYQVFPERLHGLIVAVEEQGGPIGIAGLRTHDTQPNHGHRIVQVMLHELGIARVFQYQLWVRLTVPPPYQVQRHEAYVHSMTVTASWRGRGIAARLLDRLHGMTGDLGKSTVVVQVAERNLAARRLYARYGYTVRQRQRNRLARLPFGPSPRLLLEKHLKAGLTIPLGKQQRFE